MIKKKEKQITDFLPKGTEILNQLCEICQSRLYKVYGRIQCAQCEIDKAKFKAKQKRDQYMERKQ